MEITSPIFNIRLIFTYYVPLKQIPSVEIQNLLSFFWQNCWFLCFESMIPIYMGYRFKEVSFILNVGLVFRFWVPINMVLSPSVYFIFFAVFLVISKCSIKGEVLSIKPDSILLSFSISLINIPQSWRLLSIERIIDFILPISRLSISDSSLETFIYFLSKARSLSKI